MDAGMIRRILIFLIWFLCAAAWFVPLHAQMAPGCATGAPSCVQIGGFQITGSVLIVAMNASANVAFPSQGSSVLAFVTNPGPVAVAVAAGNSLVTVTPTTGILIPPGQSVCVPQGLYTNLAAITASGVTVLTVQSGTGACPVQTASIGAPAVAPVWTPAAAASLIAKVAAGIAQSYAAVNGGTAGWLMAFDSATLPTNGAVGASLIGCWPIAANGLISRDQPLPFANGLTLVLSSTGCFTLTLQTGSGNLGYLQAQVR
jgi:hypothetical protein